MKNRSVTRNAALNVAKQLCSILFPLITYPYISRILGAEKYGMYSFADSIVSYFVLIAGLGVNTYAIREGAKIRNDRQKIDQFASELFTINLFSTFIAYAALTVLVLLSHKLRSYAPLIFVRSIMILLTTIGVDWVNVIYEDFAYITVRYIIFQAIALVMMFLFVKSPEDVLIYTLITVLAAGGGNLCNVFYVKRYVRLRLKINDIKKHLLPILILFANNIAITIYVNSDITMLGYFSTDAQIGIYSLSSKIYNLTKSVINAIVIACMPRLAYLSEDREKYQEYLNSIFSSLFMLCAPIVVGIIFLSRQIIGIVGGTQYTDGAASLSILSLAIFGAIGGSFFSNCILIQHKEEANILKATVTAAIINILLNFLFLPKLGINGAALTTVIAELTACVMEGFCAGKYVDIKDLASKELLNSIIGAVLTAAVCFVSSRFITNTAACLAVSVCVSAVIYLFVNRNNRFIKSVFSKLAYRRK